MIPKFRKFFKSNKTCNEEERSRIENRTNQYQLSSIINQNGVDCRSGARGMEKRNIAFSGIQHGHSFIDDNDDEPPPLMRNSDSRPAPHWLDGPRDSAVLPDIIASTYSDYSDEADYAMKQMLAILETLNPVEDNNMELFGNSLKAIEFRLPFDLILNEDNNPDWQAIRQKLLTDSMKLTTSSESSDRPGLSNVQMSAVFDAIPFLFDAVACNHELKNFQNTLSMIVLIAMTGNSMIRRQSINAIQALMERSMLSQDFMRDGIVPGLFHIYQSGVGAFQSSDLRMECVQATTTLAYAMKLLINCTVTRVIMSQRSLPPS
ncbi:hypothetical protein GCK72_000005 [Caenorhabditis remanei]|uniref:Uncharacterized protein n=1 Tax=Caenorhabditis remanei TaxID=31234 RepID=A0A6A5HPK0_CAERE|nr:hypothetical protein GCK72_000005 [Caenorhabditis remanei]KAF1768193.1 hypothetical protein GCK72_000005 [Caenorhabditis remanei]